MSDDIRLCRFYSMKNRTKLYLILFGTIISLGLFSAVLVHALWYAPDTEIPVPIAIAQSPTVTDTSPSVGSVPVQSIAPASSSDLPVKLVIPALHINAKVQYVGITKNGNMGVPNNFTDVGWYKYGALPGQVGSAVIAGHVDDGLAFPGVFKNLGNLVKGDDIYVDMGDGTVVHFTVQSLATYPYNAIVPQVFDQDDNKYLKLITCAGVFVEKNGTHNERLVVTAVED